MIDDRCRHELPVESCGICTPPAQPPSLGSRLPRRTTAHYEGTCTGCGGRIYPGDQIGSDSMGGWLCELCT